MSNLSQNSRMQKNVSSSIFVIAATDNSAAVITLMGNATCALCVFQLIGRLVGNVRTTRDSTALGVFICLMHWSSLYNIIDQALRTPTGLYLVGTLFLQVGAATTLQNSIHSPQEEDRPAELGFLKPTLLPCRTTHTRLFPSKHAFSYSYLFVGIPVEWEGFSGKMLSVGDAHSNRTWFSVCADDYLARGRHTDGLRGKLKEYLSSQGVPADRYSHAYLVTAPRFLGFSFNPVSFWYLYDHTRALSAMILEVNNTFDERRMYFMESECNASTTLAGVFTNSWSKDFHVSPFNDRDGSYSLTAKDFMFQANASMIDNNIVLRDEKGKAKIVAQVYSTGSGIDPSKLSRFAVWRFLARWWWVGFATNLRILKEARVLWIKKLQVYYRPEVFRTSIGRNETANERIIEPYFRAFLKELVNLQERSKHISYRPAAGPDRGSVLRLYKNNDQNNASSSEMIEIDVLTPAFYTEIVRHSSVIHAFAKACFESTDRENMLYVSDHEILREWLQIFTSRHKNVSPVATLATTNQRVLSCLRIVGMGTAFRVVTRTMLGRKEQHLDPSDFDLFIGLSHSREARRVYLRTAQRMVLADQIAFGFDWLLNGVGYALCLVCVIQLNHIIGIQYVHSLAMGELFESFVCMACFHQIRAFFTITTNESYKRD